MTIKGNHYEKGQKVPDGERKLYLIIEGPTETVVKRAKVCFIRCLPVLLAENVLCELLVPRLLSFRPLELSMKDCPQAGIMPLLTTQGDMSGVQTLSKSCLRRGWLVSA